jgi:hypothetical protein
MTAFPFSIRAYTTLGFVAVLLGIGCSSDGKGGKTPDLVEGMTEFSSAPPNGQDGRNGGNPEDGGNSLSPSAPGAQAGARYWSINIFLSLNLSVN